MSLRAPARTYPRMAKEAYYTPFHATERLLDVLPAFPLMGHEIWEPAAGAGHMALVLSRRKQVLATDLNPARKQVYPVNPLDFLKSTGPSGEGPLAIITNPPYGAQNRLAIDFLRHGLALTEDRKSVV